MVPLGTRGAGWQDERPALPVCPRSARQLAAVSAVAVMMLSARSVSAAPAETKEEVSAEARPLPGASTATSGDVGAQLAAGARGYTGVREVQAPPPRSPGRMPGSRTATTGDVGSKVASGVAEPPNDDDEDERRGAALPGADEATGGDVAARVASGAAADEFHPWEVGGFIDANYAYNNNLPDNHVNRGTATQPRTGEFTLNLAVAYIRRDALPGRLSPTFELALQAGPSADALMRDEPTPGADASRVAGSEVWKHLARANVGLKARVGTEVTAGLLLSPIGIGIHWTPYNWNYTPSWQLDGVPYYLAGLRVVHPINARHGVQLWVVNGWQTAADNNKAPSFMLGYTFTPSPRFAFAQYAYTGPENADMRLGAWRLFSDSQFTYNTERFGVSAVFDFGAERRTDLPGKPWNIWSSGAVFTRWRVLGERRTWDMGLRPDWFYDRNGRIFGVSQHLLAGTYTNDVRIAENLLLRVEYRYDRSISQHGFFYRGAAITDDATGLAHDQHTVFFSIAGVFAHRFGKVKR
jgi:hypothetical protein